MSRLARSALIIGVLALALWVVMALFDAQVMPSYLAAWLFWMAVPLGALPLVMALEGLGDMTGGVIATLRRLLPMLPVGALLAIPVLFSTASLFRRAELRASLPAAWMAPGAFVGRTVAILVLLSAFALLFSRAPRRRPRRGLAAIGLILHVGLLSVAAVDWLLSLQPGLGSAALGLLLIASQAGSALALAALAIATGVRSEAHPPSLGPLLAALAGLWAFLHFIQYLAVWSPNLPAEIVWYQVRTPGFGGFALWFGVIAAALAIAVLPTRLGHVPPVLASIASMLLLAHLLETLWLVTPAFRGRFTLDPADALAVVGLGGLAVAGLAMLFPTWRRSGNATA